MDGAIVVVRIEGRAGNPNEERRKYAISGRAQIGIYRDVQQLVVPRTSRVAEVGMECVSKVIYQNVYLIRLINVSGFLSN